MKHSTLNGMGKQLHVHKTQDPLLNGASHWAVGSVLLHGGKLLNGASHWAVGSVLLYGGKLLNGASHWAVGSVLLYGGKLLNGASHWAIGSVLLYVGKLLNGASHWAVGSVLVYGGKLLNADKWLKCIVNLLHNNSLNYPKFFLFESFAFIWYFVLFLQEQTT